MNRIFGVIKKEIKEFFRDKFFVLTIIVEPIVMMFIFGNTFQGDIKHLKAIIIDEDKTEYSQKLVSAINNSSNFQNIGFSGDLNQSVKELKNNKARVIFYIPSGFKNWIKNAQQGDIQIYIDSSDYNIYNIVKGYAGLVLKDGLQEVIQLIVGDLETEKGSKQKQLDNIQNLVNGLNSKTQKTLKSVDNVDQDFDETRNLVAETQSKILKTQSLVVTASNNVESIKQEVNDIKGSLDGFSSSSDDITQEISNIGTSNPLIAPYLVTLTDKIKSAQNQTNDKINSLKDKINKSQDKINSLSIPSSDSVSSKNYNIDKFYKQIDDKQKEVNSINKTANEIEDTYRDIQNMVDDINLEFNLLKRDFISDPIFLSWGYIYGEISYFQYLAPSIMALSLFFIGIMLTVLNIINERTNKTLFKLAATPLKKSELLLGKFIVFFGVGIFEAIYFILLSVFAFGVEIKGDFFNVLLILLLLMGSSIGLGLLISVLIKTMKQAVMVIPLIILPAILISNIFSPVEVMPKYMLYLAKIFPLYHANFALKEIIIKGVGLSAVITSIEALSFFMVINLLLGIIFFKKRID